MNIFVDAERGVFRLDTPRSTYIMALADGKWLGHVYYGPRLADGPLDWAAERLDLDQPPYTPDSFPREAASFFDRFPSEFPAANAGDFRECCLAVRCPLGTVDGLPEFRSARILPGKPALEGLPAAFGGEEACSTLAVLLEDGAAGLEVELLYTAFSRLDVITRSVRVRNTGGEPLQLERCLSACLTLPYEGQDMLTLHGSWARERGIQLQPVARGFQGAASRRGISSHQEHPFLAVVSPDAAQERGEVYAMHFVYSGNFLAQVQRDQFDQLRMVMGIHPDNFSWRLEPGEAFQAPEVVMTFSGGGLGGMTRTLHDLYRSHLIRRPCGPRPVLINNWEATYFDFDEARLLEIAARAAELGVELFVLDDGWFENRPMESGGLGDWRADRKKLPGGLGGLAEKIEALGMRFGLWMEPEMVSINSDIYRAHPDWAISAGRRTPQLCRDQLVLDLGRPEVEEYVWERISSTLHSAPISYLKWDMNRPLTNLGSAGLPPDRQGEVSHRYVLALYRLQRRLTEEFPDLLLENCCSGGGRFDPGMLYYSPQIWCSDDTDAVERLRIQEGTAMLYPLSSIGSHVSVCPNHIVGRVTPFHTRGVAAMAGTFGYELDVTVLSPEEQRQVKEQIVQYRALQPLLQSGDYYRIASAGDGGWDCQMVVSRDRSEAAVYIVRVLDAPNQLRKRLRLQGLDPCAIYEDQESRRRFPGDVLCRIGLPVSLPCGDFQGMLLRLRRVAEEPA